MKILLIKCSFLLCLFVLAADAQVNRHTLRERLVIQDLSRVGAAQVTYLSMIDIGQYAPSLARLHEVGLIDAALAGGEKYGYSFALHTVIGSPGNPPSFSISATPRVYGRLGVRSFFYSPEGLFRGGDLGGRPATANDPILEDDACTNGGLLLNEQCIIQTLRIIGGAQLMYANTEGAGNFAPLSTLGNIGLLDRRTASGVLRGYLLSVSFTNATPTEPARFTVFAVPQIYGATGTRSFRIDTDNVLRGADRQGGPAAPDDPPVNY